ncbi:MAG: thiamine-phosphate kinase [Elusimicrobia bacterium]|nr:thiamine-phosphate kinase [Elusimicrobiota bacterium]
MRTGGARTMGDVGEWGLLKKLLPRLSRDLSKRVMVGPGDDAALLRIGGDIVAITTDMLVEGVHFRVAWGGGEDLGHKTLAVNLSDLAAMGDVEPVAGVLAAGLPASTPVNFVADFYRGFSWLARRHGFELVGGDTVRSDRMTFSLTVLGRVRGRVFKRSGARAGDALMVTGTLGDAGAGLALLEKSSFKGPGQSGKRGLSSPKGRAIRFLVNRFLRPTPRLEWARRLAKTGAVTACLDASDGFWKSVTLLSDSSRVGAEVWTDRLPVSPALRRWAGDRAEGMALVGGEDYELVFTARRETARRIESMGFARVVGSIVPSARGVKAYQNGRPREVPSVFEHFNG